MYRLYYAADIASWEDTRWCVRNLIPERGFGLIVGDKGTGKSFLAIDCAAAITEGRPWYGMKVDKPLPSVYLCLEGESGVKGRVQAWQKQHGRPIPFAWVIEPFKLNPGESEADFVQLLINTCRDRYPSGCALFIDTLYRASAGIEENTSQGMQSVVEASKRLSEAINGPVIMVHHTTKSTGTTRGHGSLSAATDFEIHTRRNRREETWHWVAGKVKDGPDDLDFSFYLHPVDVGAYPDGERRTSVVALPGDRPTTEDALSERDTAVIAALSGKNTTEHGALILIKSLFEDEQPKYRKQAMRRTLNRLVRSDKVSLLQESNGIPQSKH